MRMRRPSTTSSAWRLWSSRAARVDALLKLGKVLELVGDWQARRGGRRRGASRSPRSSATSARGRRARAALAEVARKQGRFDEAVARLDRAARGFATVGEESGVARVYHLAGTIAAQRGDYAKAVENYEASLAIREREGDKASMGSLLSNLGIVAEYRGDYDHSRGFHERALGTAHRDRRPSGHRQFNEQSRDDRRPAEALRRGARLVPEVDTPQPRGRRRLDGRAVPQQPGQRDAGPRRLRVGRGHYADSLRAYRSLRRQVGAGVPARGHWHTRGPRAGTRARRSN